MKLLKKTIVKLDKEIPVYDIHSSSGLHNFCLGNGIVVHNSKDIFDAVDGCVFDLYCNLDLAGQLSNKYKVKQYNQSIEQRRLETDNSFQDQIQGLFG